MTRKGYERYLSRRIVLLLALGAFTAFLASMIAGKAEITLGTSASSYLVAAFLSFVLFAVTGVLWVAVAVAVKELEEK